MTEFKSIFLLFCCSIPFIANAQCPITLDNTNGLGNLTLFFEDNNPPEGLPDIDVDFPEINGNFDLNEFPTTYQTISNAFSGVTLTGEITLNFNDGSSVGCVYEEGEWQNPLPVDLIRFTGQLEKNNIILSWQTASESENLLFDIERSFDGFDFEVIGMTPGAGTSNSVLEYNFEDLGVKNRALGTHAYYRLSQIDYDGTRTYSDLIAIDLKLDFEKFEITEITGWDTADRQLKVYYYSPDQVRKINVLISDISGNALERKSVYPESGLNSLEIDLSKYEETTLFILSLDNGQSLIAEKVMLGKNF